MLGGFLGRADALFQEIRSPFPLLLPIIGAPIIEEALKLTGIYLPLIRWPHALRSRFHTAVLTALSGLTFGLIESAFYVLIYFPEGGDDFVAFRFSVTLALHATASLLVGLGLSWSLIDWARDGGSFPRRARNFFIAGMSLHALYNTTAIILTVTGVLDFREDP